VPSRTTTNDRPRQLVAAAGHQPAQCADAGRLAEQVAGRREQQVRLPLARWQRRQERQDLPVTCHRHGQGLIRRGTPVRLEPGEPAVLPRGARERILAGQ
jgi:hypothetical protein